LFSFPLDDVANLTANEADRGDDEPEGGEECIDSHGGYFLSVFGFMVKPIRIGTRL
jgi:hypothetical protein